MKNPRSIVLAICLLVAFPGVVPAKILGIIYDVTGEVQYSHDRVTWQTVALVKRFKDKLYIKTGSNGTCKIELSESKETKLLGNDSLVVLEDRKLELIRGQLNDFKQDPDLMQAVKRRLHISQSYTTTRIDEAILDASADIIILEDEFYPPDTLNQIQEME
jgi:hypothetical protein